MFNCGDLLATIANNAGANITDIHVWDGANRIQKFGGFKLFGTHNRNLVDTNVLHKLPAPIDVFFGVEIACTYVQQGPDGDVLLRRALTSTPSSESGSGRRSRAAAGRRGACREGAARSSRKAGHRGTPGPINSATWRRGCADRRTGSRT